MSDEMKSLLATFDKEIAQCKNLEQLDQLRVHYLGKQGFLTNQMKQLGSLPAEERKAAGAVLNEIKQHIALHIDQKKDTLEQEAILVRLETERVDISMPVRTEAVGRIHPITQAIEEITAILGSMGFVVEEGPNIEEEFYNFDALNIPESHPARAMHDTFYLPPTKEEGKPLLLRTHTSPVQIRAMQKGKGPFRIMAPGRTYRCDSDITHSPMFHQVEGLWVDESIHMGHLKGCLTQFLHRFFELDEVPIRFRPSFFPFTEPSAEVDIGCLREGGTLTIGAGHDWLEVLGCGMVHPNVLKNVGLDPTRYQGFAFGLGVERLAMLKYGIPDLRTFFDSDIRWLNHYGFHAFDIPSLVGGLTR